MATKSSGSNMKATSTHLHRKAQSENEGNTKNRRKVNMRTEELYNAVSRLASRQMNVSKGVQLKSYDNERTAKPLKQL